MKCLKEPKLRLRYAIGLGDIIACFLHSKLISPITKLITGKDKPCLSCSMRTTALNILIPLPMWRLFFKNETEKNTALAQDLEDCGYNVKLINNKLTATKTETKQDIRNQEPPPAPTIKVTSTVDHPPFLNFNDQVFLLTKKNHIQENNCVFVTLLYRKQQ